MSLAVENLEHSMAKLTITVPAEEFGKAMTTAYNKQKGKFNVPGFRKGHVPQAFIVGIKIPASIIRLYHIYRIYVQSIFYNNAEKGYCLFDNNPFLLSKSYKIPLILLLICLTSVLPVS